MIAQTASTKERKNRSMLVYQAVLVAAICIILGNFDLFERFERNLIDQRIAFLSPTDRLSPDIVVVGLDTDSMSAMDPSKPIDRRYLSRLLKKIDQASPAAVALDVILDKPAEPIGDAMIKAAISQSISPIVLARDVLETQFLRAIANGRNVAPAGIPIDGDGVARAPAQGNMLAHAILVIGGLATKAEPARSIAGWPLSRSGTPPFVVVPARLVIDGRVNSALFTDKIVYIGVTVPGRDEIDTPLNRTGRIHAPLPGVLVHAYLSRDALASTVSPYTLSTIDFALTLCFALLGSWLGSRLWSASVRLLALAASVVVLFFGVFALFASTQVIVWLVPPTLAIFGAAGSAAMFAHLYQSRSRHHMEKVIGNYIGTEVLSMLQQSARQLPTQPQSLELSIMFCDLVDFTTMVGREDDEFIRAFLSDYIDQICRTVVNHGGIVDNVMGDGILAIFGVSDSIDPKSAACDCAIDIVTKCRAMAGDVQFRGYGRTAIGLHHGVAMFGAIGGETRRVFSAYGLNVNIAARLQKFCNELGADICATREILTERIDGGEWIYAARSNLKGVPLPIDIWKLA